MSKFPPDLVQRLTYFLLITQDVQLQLITHRNTINNHSSLFSGSSSRTVTGVGVGTGGATEIARLPSPSVAGTAVHRDSMSMLTLSDASNSLEHIGVTGGGTSGAQGGGDNEDDDDPRSGFALVINGHSLVHALSAELEMLFLGVAERCNGEDYGT